MASSVYIRKVTQGKPANQTLVSAVCVEDGVAVAQWSYIKNGNGGFINEPQDLVGASLSEILKCGYHRDMSLAFEDWG
jgi:hypothetical protein